MGEFFSGCASVGYTASICYFKTPLDEMREARAWLEDIREQRKVEEALIFDWPSWPSNEPIAMAYA